MKLLYKVLAVSIFMVVFLAGCVYENNNSKKPETVTLKFNAYEVDDKDIKTPLLTKFNYAVVAVRTDALEKDNPATDYKEGDNLIGLVPETVISGKQVVISGISAKAKYLRVAVPRNAMVATYIDLTKYNLAANAGNTVDVGDVILKHRKDYALNVAMTREDFLLAGYPEDRANGIKDIYVTGPFNGWNTKDEKYKLVEDKTTGIYTFEFTGLGATEKFEYKFCNDGSWANGGGSPEIFADNFGQDGIFWDKNTERHYNNDGIWSNSGGSNGFATILGKPVSRTEADISGFVPQEVDNDTGATHAITVKMPYMLVTDDIAFNRTKVVAEYTYLDGTAVPMVNVATKEPLATNKITYVYDKSNANWKTGTLVSGTSFLANRIAFTKLPAGIKSRPINIKFTVTDKNNVSFTKMFMITQTQKNSVKLGDVSTVVLERSGTTGEYSKTVSLAATGEFAGVGSYVWIVKKDGIDIGQPIYTTVPNYELTISDRNFDAIGKYSVKVELVVGGVVTVGDTKSFDVVKTANLSSNPSAGITKGGIAVLMASTQGGEAIELKAGENVRYDWTIYKDGVLFATTTSAVNNISQKFDAVGDYKFDVVINAVDSLDKLIKPLYMSTSQGLVKVRVNEEDLEVKFDVPPSVQFIVRDEFGVFDSNTPRDTNANMIKDDAKNIWKKDYVATGTQMVFKFTQGNAWNPVINGKVASQYGVMYEPHEMLNDGSGNPWDTGSDVTPISVDTKPNFAEYSGNVSEVTDSVTGLPLNWQSKPFKYSYANASGGIKAKGDNAYGHIDIGEPSKGGANSGTMIVTPGYKYEVTLDFEAKIWKIELKETPNIAAGFDVVQNNVTVTEDASKVITVGAGSIVTLSSTAIIASEVTKSGIGYIWTIKNLADNKSLKITKNYTGDVTTFAAITAGAFEVKLEMTYGGVVASNKIKNINVGMPIARERVSYQGAMIDKAINFYKSTTLKVVTSAAFAGFDSYNWNIISPTGEIESLSHTAQVTWMPKEIGDFKIRVEGVTDGKVTATPEFTISVGVTYDFANRIVDVANGEKMSFSIAGDNNYFDKYTWIVYRNDVAKTPFETIVNATSSGIWVPYKKVNTVGKTSEAANYMMRLTVTKDGKEYSTDWNDGDKTFLMKFTGEMGAGETKTRTVGATVNPFVELSGGATFDSASLVVYKVVSGKADELVDTVPATVSASEVTGAWKNKTAGTYKIALIAVKGNESYESSVVTYIFK